MVLAALGDFGAAAEELSLALAGDTENAECHYNLGNVRKAQGRLGESAACYRAAIAASPGFLEAHVNLGVVLNEQGDAAGALDEYRSALALDPTSALLLKQYGSLCLKVDDREGALQAFERAVQADPDDADLVQTVGAMHKASGNLESAIRHYRRVAGLRPDSAEAWAQLGTNLFQNGESSEAYRAFENALRIKPDFPGVLNNMGMVMKEKGQVALAEKCYSMAIRTDPGYAPAYNNLGTLYLDGSRFSEAEAQFREAVRLDPGYLLAWNNLGNALAGQGSYHEAKQIYRLVIAEDPTIPEVHFNLAAALAYENRMAESIRGYDEAVRLRPEYYEARLNKALILLQRGEFEEGWKEYEWRFRVRDPRRAHVPPVPKGAQWDGTDVRGKRILVRFEQGFGDTIQFARYIPLLASRGAVVVFECPRELAGLFKNFPGVSSLMEYTGTPPDAEYDAYVQLLSLPRLLGTCSVESIPWSGPYIHPDPDAANIFGKRINRELFNVGVVWGGNPLHTNDHNRSCPLRDFIPLFGIPGARFYSLQKGAPAARLRTLPECRAVVDLDAELKDFSVTAGVLSCLDLVIAVDTSVAHLAGAMGIPAWTLLPCRSDWRWLLDRTDSPWYPGMRLFRQRGHADWPGLLREVRTELGLLIANRQGHE